MSQALETPAYTQGQHVTAVVFNALSEPVRLDGRIERVVVRPSGFVYYQLSTRRRLVPQDRILRASAVTKSRRLSAVTGDQS